MGRHCLTMMTFGVPKDNVHSRIRLVIHMSRDMSEKNRARTNVGPVIGRPRKPRSVADPRSNRASAQVSVPATLEGSGHQSTSHAAETHVSPPLDHDKSPET